MGDGERDRVSEIGMEYEPLNWRIALCLRVWKGDV